MMLISAAYAADAANTAAESGGFFSQTESWVLVAFLIVAALLYRPASKALVKMLDGRRDEIKRRLDEAEQLHKDAQKELANHQQRLREAKRDAEEMLATARAEAERLTATGKRDLDELLARREQQALARIAQAEADAVGEVRGVAVDLAVAAARKIIAESMTPDRAAALADKTIKDLGERLH
jgi:F-type H+-transporting ATPase subunit b